MRTKNEILASSTGLANADDYETMRLAILFAQSTANNAVVVMWPVNNEGEMLALSNAKKGHFAKRNDLQSGKKWIYVLNSLPASDISNWSPFALWYTESSGSLNFSPMAYLGGYQSTQLAPYPTSGGTGEGGAIKAGNTWFNEGSGWFGRKQLTARIDNPGANPDNWWVINEDLGFTPINVSARVNEVSPSNINFPNNNAVINYVTSRLASILGTLTEPSSTKYVAVTELLNALNLKADINYVHGLIKGFAWKDNVRVATTANITLSGTQNIDGVALSADQRVLVKNQTDATQNGIYLVKAGAWVRSDDADNAAKLRGATVNVEEGSTNGDKQFTQNTDNIVLGASNLNFKETGGAATFAGLIGSPSDNAALAAALLAKANDDAVVKLTGDQTIAGVKEFTTGIRAFRTGREEASTLYTLQLSDRGQFLVPTSSSPVTIIVPPNSTVAFALDTEIEICRGGTGEVTIQAGSGVTILTAGNRRRITEQHGAVVLKKRGTDTWRLIGGTKV